MNGGTTFTEARSKTEDARTIPVPDPVMTMLTDHIAGYLADVGREDCSTALVVAVNPPPAPDLCHDLPRPPYEAVGAKPCALRRPMVGNSAIGHDVSRRDAMCQ